MVSATTAVATRRVGGRYVLRSCLGTGGMGEVWSAYDEILNRNVAVKGLYLRPEVSAQEREELKIRSLREARAAARVSSPTAVAVYDVFEDNGRPWIVMELLNSRSLAEVLRSDGPLPVESVARIGLAVLEALQAAHEAGVVHRDVKPANVLLATDGRIALTDFGVATLDGDSGMTITGMVMGSPAYMAPERAQGSEPTPAMDLWGLGATLFAAIEGRGPFSRKDALTTLHAVLTEPLPQMHRAGPLAPLLEGLLQRDPQRRLNAATTRTWLLKILRQLTGQLVAVDTAATGDNTGIELDLDTAALKVLAVPPASVLAKPPLDADGEISGSTGRTSAKSRTGTRERPGLWSLLTQWISEQKEKHTTSRPRSSAGSRRAPQKATLSRQAPAKDKNPFRTTPASDQLAPVLAALLATTLVIAVIVGAWYGIGKLRGGPVSQDPQSSSAFGGNSTGPSWTYPPAGQAATQAPLVNPDPPEPPAGWKVHRDNTGFFFLVPVNWKQDDPKKSNTSDPRVIQLSDPDTNVKNSEGKSIGRFISFQRAELLNSSDQARERASNIERSMPSNVANYQRIRTDQTVSERRDIRQLEFRWNDDSITTLHVRHLLLTVPGVATYEIYVSSPESMWESSQDEFQVMIDSFQPFRVT